MDVKFNAVICYREQFEKGRSYYPVSAKRFVREEDMREQWVVSREAACHPRGIGYYAPAAARAVVHAVERPGSVVAGFSALALYGLPFLVEGADTTLLARVAEKTAATATTPALQRIRRGDAAPISATHRGVTIQVSPPSIAVADALRQIKRREHRWATASVPGLSDTDVMAIQLIDCVRRFLGISLVDLQEAAQGQLNARWLKKILPLTSAKADSPMETELRLLVSVIVAKYGLQLQEQVTLYDGNRIVTTFDLAIADLKIAVMYDGRHHMDFQQRKKDSLINITSSLHGWTVVRCFSETRDRCLEVLEQLIVKELRARGLLKPA